MPRDYAKKPQRRPKYPPIPGWVWMTSGLIIGLFVALLVYLNQQPAEPIKLPSFETPAGMKDTRDVRKDEEPPPPPGPSSAPEPRFEFYNILPDLEVAVPDEEIEPERKTNEPTRVKATPPAPSRSQPPAASDGVRYVLQAGSFKQLKQADGFKAHLALLGLQAEIQSATIDGTEWHRVRLGPFTDVDALNRTRSRLDENDIQAVVLKIKE